MCDPARATGRCRTCGGAGRVVWFEMPVSEWGSASSSVPPDGTGPCGTCGGSGLCFTCQGAGALEDEAWDDAILQPYFAGG
jgi:hypothetical protein